MKRIIIDTFDPILVTGANGFIGVYVVKTLVKMGYCNIRCFVRPSSDTYQLGTISMENAESKIDIFKGDLIDKNDCENAVKDIKVIYHLAAGREKSFAGAFMNSVITTRNLLDAVKNSKVLLRFVLVSSFAVYSNFNMKRGEVINEESPIEDEPMKRFEPYTYAKLQQEKILMEYGEKFRIPYVIFRPGNVFGPGKKELPGRIGINTFGVFFHLGGLNKIPFTYVENCAEAIVLGGIEPNINGEIFNIVDDDLPKSSDFLKLYKKNVKAFFSIRIPYYIFYLFCFIWESYSNWSDGQLPPVFNRRSCSVFWKGNTYSNEKLKLMLNWMPRICLTDAVSRYFSSYK